MAGIAGSKHSTTKELYCRVKDWHIKNTFLRVIPTMTFQNSHVTFYVSLISCQAKVVRHNSYFLHCFRLPPTSQTDCRTFFLTFFLADLPTFFLTYLLTSAWHVFWHSVWQSPDILSDISPHILSDILSDILSHTSFDILSDILSFILSDILSDRSSDSLSDISSDTLSDILSNISPHMIAVEVRHGTHNSHDRGWGPVRNTDFTGSRLGSGKEHWAHMIAVEVRHGTLKSHHPGWGWGLARNTELTLSQLGRRTRRTRRRRRGRRGGGGEDNSHKI